MIRTLKPHAREPIAQRLIDLGLVAIVKPEHARAVHVPDTDYVLALTQRGRDYAAGVLGLTRPVPADSGGRDRQLFAALFADTYIEQGYDLPGTYRP